MADLWASKRIPAGADVGAGNHRGWTPLFSAAMGGSFKGRDTSDPGSPHLAAVKLLLSKGADVTHVDHDGNTAVHYAAGNGELGSCKAVVAAGAAVNAVNRARETPLTSLKQRARWTPARHRACAAFLVKHGAK